MRRGPSHDDAAAESISRRRAAPTRRLTRAWRSYALRTSAADARLVLSPGEEASVAAFCDVVTDAVLVNRAALANAAASGTARLVVAPRPLAPEGVARDRGHVLRLPARHHRLIAAARPEGQADGDQGLVDGSFGVADGHHWLADLGPSVPGADSAPVSIAFVLKRFAAKAPCVKIKGDFILLLELLIGHRGADGCEPRHLALLLLANSDYLIPTEKGLLSILQLLARNPEKAAALGKTLPTYEMALQEAVATREQGKGFFGKLTKAATTAMKQGQAVAEGTKQSKRDAPDVVAAANSLVLQRVHDFLKANVTAPPPLPPRARRHGCGVPRADDRRGAGGARGGHVGRPAKSSPSATASRTCSTRSPSARPSRTRTSPTSRRRPTSPSRRPSTWRGPI